MSAREWRKVYPNASFSPADRRSHIDLIQSDQGADSKALVDMLKQLAPGAGGTLLALQSGDCLRKSSHGHPGRVGRLRTTGRRAEPESLPGGRLRLLHRERSTHGEIIAQARIGHTGTWSTGAIQTDCQPVKFTKGFYGGIVKPQPNARIGFHHSPLYRRSCAPV